MIELDSNLRRLKTNASKMKEHLFGLEVKCEMNSRLEEADLAGIRKLSVELGLHGLSIPKEDGGSGYSAMEKLVIGEELGQVTNGLTWAMPEPKGVMAFGTPEQKEKYLRPQLEGSLIDTMAITEAGAGSDPQAVKTVARKVRGGWEITGEKWHATRGDVAGVFLVLAKAGADEKPTTFLVERANPGLSIIEEPKYMYNFVYGHPKVALRNAFVPEDAVLGAVGDGMIMSRRYFTASRLGVGKHSLAAATRCLNIAFEWAKERESFGKKIVDHQMIIDHLASSAAELAMLRAYTYEIAREIDGGVDEKTLHGRSAALKLQASEIANRVVDRCVQVLGSRGYMRNNPVERHYREVRVQRIWEGTSEIQKLILMNEMLKRGTGDLLGGN